LNGLAAELDHEPASAFGEQREAFGVDAFGAGVADEEIVEAFEADGLVLHDFGDVVGALKNVGIGDDQQDAGGGLSTRRQVASRTVAQVPSEPTRARATWKPFSSSR
jgi:hypothetical protein